MSHLFKILSLLSLIHLISFSAFAHPDRTIALKEWDKGINLYKKKNFVEASKHFYESNRLFQSPRTLYYYALSVSKTEGTPCQDRLYSWEMYLDSCTLEVHASGKTCSVQWVKKAQSKLNQEKRQCAPTSLNPDSASLSSNTNSSKTKVAQVSPTKVSPTKVSPTKVSPTKVSPTKVSPTKAQDSMRVSTAFLCRYKKREGYEQVRSCNGGTFREGDQVRFTSVPAQDVYAYIILYNESNQAQLLWPATGDQNLLTAGQRYFFPSDPYYKGWWEVDQVKGVTEVISLIHAKSPIRELERLRGLDIPPKISKMFIRSDMKVNKALLLVTDELRKQNITMGVSDEVVGSDERVIIQYIFKHE